MKKLAAGIAIGLVAGIATSAAAGPLRDHYLNRGDRVYGNGGATACTAAPHNGSRLGFVCKVGGDYRAAYGVIINEGEAAITRYRGFNRYRVIVRKRQFPVAP